MIALFDLDGTLADLTHRLHLIKKEKPEWDEFFSRCGLDRPNQWCADLMAALHASGYVIEIVSARPPGVEPHTRDWLKMHEIVYHRLNLIGDSKTPDHELKRAWLRSRADRRDIAFVVDDRQRVVDMWRDEGLVCLQCNAWDEYHKPGVFSG